MCYSFKGSTANFDRKHDKWGLWDMYVDSTGSVSRTGIDLQQFYRSADHEQHGWWMWSAWFIVGFAMLATKRYAKKTWTLSHYLHALLGYFILIVTIIFAAKITAFNPTESIHNALGSLCVIVTIIGSLSGTFTAGLMRAYNGDKPWSEKEKVERVAKIHRYFGYFMLFLGNVTIMTGVGHYFGDRLQGDERKVLGIFSCAVFIVLVTICEFFFRIRNNYSMRWVPTPTTGKKSKLFTPEEIDAEVRSGTKLVIFDNLVLNLNGYERIHPGGKFRLMHNLGRDISKFFLGGYQLINVKNQKPHTHSQAALDIVKSLTVGVIDQQEIVKDELYRLTNKRAVNS